MLWVCMTSDFFLPEADPWRDDAWDMIRMRPDVIFFLLTKHPQRVSACLPEDWGNGWENVFFHVACENQIRAEERIPDVYKRQPVHHERDAGPWSVRRGAGHSGQGRRGSEEGTVRYGPDAH